jgi:hypothetical protein
VGLHLVPRFAILVVLGLTFVVGRNTSLPELSASQPSASLGQAPLTPPPGSPHPAPHAASLGPAPDGLACIQNALGGVRAFAGVSSFRIRGKTKPTGATRAANTREIGVVFPDRYKRHDTGTGAHEGLTSIVGFNGNVLLSYPRSPDEVADAMMLSARREFIGQVLRRLPRRLPGVRMAQRMVHDATQERLAIDAHGSGGVATLLADPRTCIPVALEYGSGSNAYRIDLSEFRRFGNLLFATVLRTSKNGEQWTDEYVSEVEVNTPIASAFFHQ